jgi:hypothetical protein
VYYINFISCLSRELTLVSSEGCSVLLIIGYSILMQFNRRYVLELNMLECKEFATYCIMCLCCADRTTMYMVMITSYSGYKLHVRATIATAVN